MTSRRPSVTLPRRAHGRLLVGLVLTLALWSIALPAQAATPGTTTGTTTAIDPLATFEFGLLGVAALLGIAGLTGVYLTRSRR